MIEERLRYRDQADERHLRAEAGVDAQGWREGACKERPGADVDGAEHGYEPEQIDPRREPAQPDTAEDRAPVIQAAGCRISRGDLRHAERKQDEMQQPIGQPIPMAAPPAPAIPCPSELMPPDRMQMIEKEIAKFENPRIRLASSCA